ncbi:MAG: virulence RhuM family protein [Bacteroidales bacterium]|nr:virulence RhuM family protein [Bacteroidales bacterium]
MNGIFKEEELDMESNVHFLHFANSGRPIGRYNFDVIISVGYRGKSQIGTRFRRCATFVLKECLLKGYASSVSNQFYSGI